MVFPAYHSVTWIDDEHRRLYLKDLSGRFAALPEVRHYTLKVLRSAGVPSGDTDLAIQAVFNWVKRMVPYRHEYGEQIETPVYLLKNPTLGADCDGHAVLICSMLSSVGIPCRLSFWYAGAGPDVHVSAQAQSGLYWLNMDTTQNRPMGWKPARYNSRVTGSI
tara:strand:+ start:144 stop:632 length:489 start_codon:yes stop_codon:yes gene_type:complete